MKFANLEEKYRSDEFPSDNLAICHIQAELARIDIIIKREICRWQSAGQEPSEAFRGLFVSDQQAIDMMTRPLCTNWGFPDNIYSTDSRNFDEGLVKAELIAQDIANIMYSQGNKPKLHHLRDTFGLSAFDVDTLLICLAPNVDLRYELVFGYLQDNITLKNPSINLIIDLLCEPGPNRIDKYHHFYDSSVLFRNHLIQFYLANNSSPLSFLRKTLALDPTVSAWLLGAYQPNPQIRRYTYFYQKPQKPEIILLSSEILFNLGNAVEANHIMVFTGPDLERQAAAANYAANLINCPLLEVNLSTLQENGEDLLRILQMVFRDARILNAIPFLTGWDGWISNHQIPTEIAEELCNFPGVAITSGKTPWHVVGLQRERIFHGIHFDIPTYQERVNLWYHFIDSNNQEIGEDFNAIAGQFHLTSGKIRDAAASARDVAAQKGEILNEEHLFVAAREHSNPNLIGLARKLNPRYGWEDIILPDDQLALLREIASTIRCRPKVLEDWGVGQKLASSRGVTALFSGPPGTGKTMAAEIIASDLMLDLYKIDLSSIVSKYIGETEKNLERIFIEAETSNAILFFDEADALFGKRSDVRDSHDRYANIEISFLLQRMEAYNGITILATNLRANLDEAFTRRLQFAVDFPFPEKPDRLRIWLTLFPKEIPQKGDLDFKFLADTFRIAGGNIRNIIVNAAYRAADDGQYVTMEHLLHGTRRELQKMGRLIGDEINPNNINLGR